MPELAWNASPRNMTGSVYCCTARQVRRLVSLAARQVARNARPSILVIMGVLLALLLASSEFLVVQEVSRSQVESALRQLPWHLVGFGNGAEYGAYLNAITAVSSVSVAEIVGTSPIPVFVSLGRTNLTAVLDFVRPQFAEFNQSFGITGSLPPTNGSVALPKALAMEFNLSQGTSVSLWRTYYEVNQTTGSIVERRSWYNTTVSTFFEISDSTVFPSSPGFDHVFLHFDSASWILPALALSPAGLELKAYIRLTIASIVDPLDEAITSRNLDRTKRSLEISTLAFGASFAFFQTNGVSVPVILQRHYSELLKDRLTILSVSLPLIGLVLTQVLSRFQSQRRLDSEKLASSVHAD